MSSAAPLVSPLRHPISPLLSAHFSLALVLPEIRKIVFDGGRALHHMVALHGDENSGLRDSELLHYWAQQAQHTTHILRLLQHPAPARVWEEMSKLLQRLITLPTGCDQVMVEQWERAGFATIEYLELCQADKSPSSQGMFLAYSDLPRLSGHSAAHPADLWPQAWNWQTAQLPPSTATDPHPDLPHQLELGFLQLIQSTSTSKTRIAAAEMMHLCQHMSHAAAASRPQTMTLWALSAAVLEGIADDALQLDVYVKRAIAKLLTWHKRSALDLDDISEQDAREWLFFCSSTHAPKRSNSWLAMVHRIWQLPPPSPDTARDLYGRQHLRQNAEARLLLASARNMWIDGISKKSLTSEVLNKKFDAVYATLRQVAPEESLLRNALEHAIANTSKNLPSMPSLAVSIEVATALLYLDAAIHSVVTEPEITPEHSQIIVNRLLRAETANEGVNFALEPWLERLGRRIFEQQSLTEATPYLRKQLASIASQIAALKLPIASSETESLARDLTQLQQGLAAIYLTHAQSVLIQMHRDVLLLSQATPESFVILQTGLAENTCLLERWSIVLASQAGAVQSYFPWDPAHQALKPIQNVTPDVIIALNTSPPILPPQQAAAQRSSIVSTSSLTQTIDTATLHTADSVPPPPSLVPVTELPPASSSVTPIMNDASSSINTAVTAILAPAVQQKTPPKGATTVQSTALIQTSTPASIAPAIPSPAALKIDPESLKVIGPLRLDQRLYNKYLQEADEWSRRLLVDISEWAMETDKPMPSGTIAMAQSLSNSSTLIGFSSLASLASSLEQALSFTLHHGVRATALGQLFVRSAEQIRYLLHQFAAGFLKSVPADLRVSLQQVTDTSTSPPSPDAKPSAHIKPTPFESAQAKNKTQASATLDKTVFALFKQEADELLVQLTSTLRGALAQPGDEAWRCESLRTLHSLKGGLRLSGAMHLGELTHELEGRIEHLSKSKAPINLKQIESLLLQVDDIQANYLDLCNELHLTTAVAKSTVSTEPTPTPLTDNHITTEMSSSQQQAALRFKSSPILRVRALVLDKLINQTGEVIINRTRMEANLAGQRQSVQSLTQYLERLRQLQHDIELETETHVQLHSAQALLHEESTINLDRLTHVHELSRMMAESVSDLLTVQRQIHKGLQSNEDHLIEQARQTRELQQDLLHTRMIEFDSISERLYSLVRRTAKDTRKQVKLEIVGGHIEIDRGVLERLSPVLEHLIRNSVVHGIELSEVRLAKAKQASGLIHIVLTQEANDVCLIYSDDGAGLDLPKITASAKSMGLIPPDQQLTPEQTVNLIFQPGFSTSQEVTELSGRGIGMDVVRNEINGLGGHIETFLSPDEGVRFRLVVPLTMAVTQMVLMRIHETLIGVPVNLVGMVHRIKPELLSKAYQDGTLLVDGVAVPFYWAGALFQICPHSLETPDQGNRTVVVLQSAGQRVVLHVDEIMRNQEAVVKSLGSQLAFLPGLVGVTVLASGVLVLIYNPVALATVYGAQVPTWISEQLKKETTQGANSSVSTSLAPLVLVVDDSVTVRHLAQRLLEREGYRVALAEDGVQALEQLQFTRPFMVISDIEMPRMDGFDLLRHIRHDTAFKDLPIVLITSRVAQKHHDHALSLGANHYLGKPFVENELLKLVQRYLPSKVKSLQSPTLTLAYHSGSTSPM